LIDILIIIQNFSISRSGFHVCLNPTGVVGNVGVDSWCQFHQYFTLSFYARRFRKRKKTLIAISRYSTRVKAARETFMALRPGKPFPHLLVPNDTTPRRYIGPVRPFLAISGPPESPLQESCPEKYIGSSCWFVWTFIRDSTERFTDLDKQKLNMVIRSQSYKINQSEKSLN